MEINSIEIEIKNKKVKLSGGTTRKELIELLGEPDDVGGFSRKKKIGVILLYCETKFHFLGDSPNDLLWLIFQEQNIGGEDVVEFSIKLKQDTVRST